MANTRRSLALMLASLCFLNAAACAIVSRPSANASVPLSAADMLSCVGGDADCNDKKSNSDACKDTDPPTCPKVDFDFCTKDPSNDGACVRLSANTRSTCQSYAGSKDWNCTEVDQKTSCVSKKKGMATDGNCPESACSADGGTCGKPVVKTTNVSCKKG